MKKLAKNVGIVFALVLLCLTMVACNVTKDIAPAPKDPGAETPTPPVQTGEENPDDKKDPDDEKNPDDEKKPDDEKNPDEEKDPDPVEKTIIEQINDAIANHQKTENEAGYPPNATFEGMRVVMIGSKEVAQIMLKLPNGEIVSRYIIDSTNSGLLDAYFDNGIPYIRQIGGNSNSKNDGTPNDFAIMFTENTISEKDYYDLVLNIISNQPARNGTGILIVTGLTGGDANNVSESFGILGIPSRPNQTAKYITTQEEWDELVAQFGTKNG